MIRIEDIDKTKSVYQNVMDILIAKGFECYPPATKKGECKRPYIVVKVNGSSQRNEYSSRVVYIRFLLYVPQNDFSKLDEFEKAVKETIDEYIYPLIKYTGQNEVDFFDDNINGHLRTMLYRYNERDRHL